MVFVYILGFYLLTCYQKEIEPKRFQQNNVPEQNNATQQKIEEKKRADSKRKEKRSVNKNHNKPYIRTHMHAHTYDSPIAFGECQLENCSTQWVVIIYEVMRVCVYCECHAEILTIRHHDHHHHHHPQMRIEIIRREKKIDSTPRHGFF